MSYGFTGRSGIKQIAPMNAPRGEAAAFEVDFTFGNGMVLQHRFFGGRNWVDDEVRTAVAWINGQSKSGAPIVIGHTIRNIA